MKTLSYLVSVALASSAVAEPKQKTPVYQQRGYSLEEVSETWKPHALNALGYNEEFKRLRGLKRSCEKIYKLNDPAGRTVGYGSICKTSHENEKGFFCWGVAGEDFAYARKPFGADAAWIGESILHGCGGELVPVSGSGDIITDAGTSTFTDYSPLAELAPAKWRPVLAMLESDIEDHGFDIRLVHCEKIRFIRLGREKNTAYAATCQINPSGKKALICFDNFIGHFGLFTNYKDTSKWAENTIYGYCWGG